MAPGGHATNHPHVGGPRTGATPIITGLHFAGTRGHMSREGGAPVQAIASHQAACSPTQTVLPPNELTFNASAGSALQELQVPSSLQLFLTAPPNAEPMH